MNPSRNITDLPLEVLGLIFKKLRSLEDRLCLAQVHPHFGLAFSCHYRQRFTKLYLSENHYYFTDFVWSETKLSVLLPLCGSSVEYISGSDMLDVTIWKLVQLHCPNLQSIEIYIYGNNINSIKTFLANVRSVRSMTLIASEDRLGNNLGILELLRFQPSLRGLCLRDFSSDELLEVRKLVNLEELIIDNCTDDRLSIDGGRLNASKEFDGVPCPALRKLYLCEGMGTPSLLKWILSHAEGLEELTLNIHFLEYEPETVIYKILSECKNLRSFRKSIYHVVDTDFAHRVVKIVSENGVTSEERPLELYFRNSDIHHAIQKVMDNTSAKQLITFKNFF